MALMTWEERANMIKRIDSEIREAQFQVARAKDALARLRALKKATNMIHTGDPVRRDFDIVAAE